MNRFFKLLVGIAILVVPTMKAFSTEYYVEKELSLFFTPTNVVSNANAVCFFYADSKYKCACRKPTNIKLWTSGDINRITGFSVYKKYGIIEDCN